MRAATPTGEPHFALNCTLQLAGVQGVAQREEGPLRALPAAAARRAALRCACVAEQAGPASCGTSP